MNHCIEKMLILLCLSFALASCNSNDNVSKSNDTIKAQVIENVTSDKNANESSDEIIQNYETITQKNVVVKQPIMNEVTFEISEKLVGRYEVEGFPDTYFEIKPNGELEITIMTFDGVAEYRKSSNLTLTAFYHEGYETIICFNIVGGENTFPGGYLSFDFVGDCDCTYFSPIDDYYKNEKYVKVN